MFQKIKISMEPFGLRVRWSRIAAVSVNLLQKKDWMRNQSLSAVIHSGRWTSRNNPHQSGSLWAIAHLDQWRRRTVWLLWVPCRVLSFQLYVKTLQCRPLVPLYPLLRKSSQRPRVSVDLETIWLSVLISALCSFYLNKIFFMNNY